MEGEDREAQEVGELLARLARAEAPSPAAVAPPPGLAELEAVSTLLAHALPPETPRPELRQRLLAALPAGQAATAPAPAAAELAPVVDLAAFARRERRAYRTVQLLAAALVLCLIGVAYLIGRVSEQEERLVARADLEQRLEHQDAELATLTQRLHMVTSVARYAYRLQSVATPASLIAAQQKPPQGIVYVCGHHQRWILSLENLAPPPPGYDYHVIFHSAGGEVDGGVLRVGSDARAGMEDVKLPPGTRGFSVMLEPAGNEGDPLLVLQSSPGVRL